MSLHVMSELACGCPGHPPLCSGGRNGRWRLGLGGWEALLWKGPWLPCQRHQVASWHESLTPALRASHAGRGVVCSPDKAPVSSFPLPSGSCSPAAGGAPGSFSSDPLQPACTCLPELFQAEAGGSNSRLQKASIFLTFECGMRWGS